MSTQAIPTTQDPSKYFRTGVAITLANKAILEERLAAVGLKSVGDLVTAFVMADGIVDAVKPVVANFQQNGGKRAARESAKVKVKEVVGQLQGLSQEQLDKLIALAKAV